MRPFVKICGLTGAAAAVHAAAAGADAVGLVFAESPRKIDTARAAEIVAALPAVTWKVGLFVNADAKTINAHIKAVGLTHVQLHGDESPDLLPLLNAPALKAFRLRDEQSVTDMRAWLNEVESGSAGRLAAVLVDAFCPDARGGTGKRIDRSLLETVRETNAFAGMDHLMLAGGLTPENVADAIQLVQPWGVDVSSGVEASPGVKDLEKVRRFIVAARS